MRKTGLVICVAAALLCVVSAAPARADIVGNGGFELAGVGGPTDSAMWTEFISDAGNTSARDSAHPASGSYAHHLRAVGLAAMGTVAGINQNSINDVGLPSLVGGSTLSASFDAALPLGPGGVMNYTLRVLNRYGGIVAIYNNTIPNNTGLTYNTYTTPVLTVPAFGAVPNDLYAAFIEINVAAGGFLGSTAEAYVDNVHINGTVMPEPASLMLLGLGALLLRRR
jgi:hypothetical protein